MVVACIACGMCVKTCKFDAIHLVKNVAVIDYEKCVSCRACAQKCPTGAIAGKIVKPPKPKVAAKPKVVTKPAEADAAAKPVEKAAFKPAEKEAGKPVEKPQAKAAEPQSTAEKAKVDKTVVDNSKLN